MPTIHIEEQKIRYRIAGQGPTIMVQAPGWGIGTGLYEKTLAPLERDFTVVYHDTRGSGGSVPVADSTSMNVGQFVTDLEALRTYLGIESFALLGHSHGGFIAMNYALAYPRNLSALVLVDSQLGVDEPREDAQRTVPKLAQDPRFAQAVGVFSSPWRMDTDEEMKALVDGVWPLYFFDPSAGVAATSREVLRSGTISCAAMKETSATNGQFLVRNRLGNITVPTLVLVGRHDFICSPVQAQAIHAGVTGSVLEVFERSGHLPWLEEPQLFFNTLGRFLAKPAAARSSSHDRM
jgi:proline iminopeptidase